MKFDWLRNSAIITKGLLRLLIADYLNLNPVNIDFVYNEFGKPYLSGILGKLKFNISHSDKIAVFAFSGSSEIGVDVEKIKTIEDMDGVINLCFTEYEKNWFNEISSGAKVETFYKIWTIKEAFIKAIGKGFSFDPKEIELTNESGDQIIIRSILSDELYKRRFEVKTLNIVPDYIISLVYEDEKDVKIYNWKNTKSSDG